MTQDDDDKPADSEYTPVKNPGRTLLKGFGWVIIPAFIFGMGGLFIDTYSTTLGKRICDGRFEIQKKSYNVIGSKDSYRFYCKSKTGVVKPITFSLFMVSFLLMYVVFSLVWLYIWYGDIYKRRPKPK